MQFDTFAPLADLGLVHHAFSRRGTVDTKAPDFQSHALQALGYSQFAAAEQPHGNAVALVSQPGIAPGVDALITRIPGLPLVIRCADCAAVFIVDQVTPAIALIHSGKKGTQLNITGPTLAAMAHQFGTQPPQCRAVISPCIGPCHYEVDLWEEIESQLRAAGVTDIHNPRRCTACHLDRYFSYRAEHGQTGRMLAVLALNQT